MHVSYAAVYKLVYIFLYKPCISAMLVSYAAGYSASFIYS